MNDSEIQETIHEMGRRALAASVSSPSGAPPRKDHALHAMASGLETRAPELIDANAKDLEAGAGAGSRRPCSTDSPSTRADCGDG